MSKNKDTKSAKKNKSTAENKNTSSKTKSAKEQTPSLQERIELFFKHHILFWLLFFPPVAIYKLIKYKICHKAITATFIVFLVLIFSLCTYIALNPTKIIDSQLEDKMTEMGYGTIRDINYLGIYDDFHVSEVTTTSGFYTVYFDSSDNGKLFINTVLENSTDIHPEILVNQYVVQYSTEKTPDLLTKIHPAAIKFLIANPSYGLIEDVIEDNHINYQVLKIQNQTYKFYYYSYFVTDIEKLNKDGDWDVIMKRGLYIEMRDEFKQVLARKNFIQHYYDIVEVNSHGISETEIYYTFTNFCGNEYKIIKTLDGRWLLQEFENNPVAIEDLAACWEEYQKELNASK